MECRVVSHNLIEPYLKLFKKGMPVNDSLLQRKETITHLIIFTCLLVGILLYDWKSDTVFFFHRYLFFLYAVLAAIALSIFRISSFLSIYGLYFITSNVFICGRFYTYFILNDSDPFGSPSGVAYYPNDLEKSRLMYYLILSFTGVHIGYLLERCLFNYDALPEKKSAFIDWLKENSGKIMNAFYLIGGTYIVLSFNTLVRVIRSGSYLALYEFQGGEYSTSVVAIFKTLFMFILGVMFSIGDKKQRRIALSFAVIIGFIYFFIGTRTSLISSILFIVWYFHNYERKISFLKVALVGVLVVTLSQYLIGLTMRGSGLDGVEIKPTNLLAFFLYDQGISLMVFEYSFQFSDWPLIMYFQSILPGVNALQHLLGFSFESQYSNIGNYLSYQLDPVTFVNGHALGWTMFGDFSVYSFQTLWGYILVSFFWGGFMSFLESCAKRRFIVRALTLSIFPQLMISPRGGFSTVFPPFFYYLVFWMLCYFLWKRISVGKKESALLT